MTFDDGRRVHASGTAIWWTSHGPADAPALVLVHSLGLDARMWQPQVEALAGDHRVVVMDLRGHGRSDVAEGPYTMERLSLDVLAVADAAGLMRFGLCGLSIGGQAAQWLAIEHGHRLTCLVLANTAARIGTSETWAERIAAVAAEGMAPLAPTVLSRWFSSAIEERAPMHLAYARERFLTTSPDGYVACCAALADSDLRARVSSIDVPTLIIAATEDVPTPPTEARFLHQAIAGSELEIIEGARHISNLDAEAAFTRALRRFLGRRT